MMFFKRTPGESMTIATPRGEIVIRVFAGNEMGIEVPPGTPVTRNLTPSGKTGSWLPARPRGRVA